MKAEALDWAARGRGRGRVVVSVAALSIGLVGVVWFDFSATRRELLALLGAQAASLHETVAAAARSNRESARLVERQLSVRLLENARLLAKLDARGGLSEPLLDETVRRHQLFRVSVFDAQGRLELAGAAQGHARRPRGFGAGRGAARLLQRMLRDGEDEVTTDVHKPRWGPGARMAAGVRRAGGGGIILNVDASAVAELRRQASLDVLLADVARHASDVAYVVFESQSLHIEHGDAPQASTPGAQDVVSDVVQRQLELAERPVIEFKRPIDLGDAPPASLRLGLRLDGVRNAERRMLWALALSMAASLTLSFLAIGTVWLRRKYALLGQQHARAEEALRRRDRLAAMGELASTVAHEIRNPLNAIAMSAQRLRREFLEAATELAEPTERAEAQELLGVVESETRRIERTVQQFQEFARPRAPVPRPTDLAQFVTTVAEAARSGAVAHDITLVVDVATSARAAFDPDLLHQALDNVVRNAIEATPPGGRVVLTARRESESDVIEVQDSGPGIAPADLPRVFDLYFTTKAAGTGVGLAVTQQIMTAHGGTIEVDSQPDAGTRMTLRLPRPTDKRHVE